MRADVIWTDHTGPSHVGMLCFYPQRAGGKDSPVVPVYFLNLEQRHNIEGDRSGNCLRLPFSPGLLRVLRSYPLWLRAPTQNMPPVAA